MLALTQAQIIFGTALGLVALGILGFTLYVVWVSMWATSPRWQARRARRR